MHPKYWPTSFCSCLTEKTFTKECFWLWLQKNLLLKRCSLLSLTFNTKGSITGIVKADLTKVTSINFSKNYSYKQLPVKTGFLIHLINSLCQNSFNEHFNKINIKRIKLNQQNYTLENSKLWKSICRKCRRVKVKKERLSTKSGSIEKSDSTFWFREFFQILNKTGFQRD